MSTIQQAPSSVVSTIDFEPFLKGSDADKKRVGEQIVQSFKDVGFVCLLNHGLDWEKVERMFEWSKRFFDLPMETKMLAPHPASGTHHRGYSPLGQEKASQHIYDAAALAEHRSKAPDVKETFDCGREDDPAMPNIWLSEDVLPGFRQACLEYFWTCFEIEKTLLRALALGFGLEEEYFLPFHTAPDNQLRLLHYPNVSFEDLRANKIIRVDGHTDFGSMTIMAQDDIGGLEVEHPSQPGNFVPVPPVPCSLVVNAGDFMMRWSNDTIKSTMHRVRAPLNFVGERVPDRYSIPYFCAADFSTVVDCIPGTWSENRPKLYEPISAGGYVLKRLAAIY